MPVRTAQLAAGRMSAAGYYSGFTVPAGYTYIVKHFTVTNLGAANTSLRIWAGRAGGDVLVGYSGVTPGTVAQYPVWLVLEVGVTIYWQLLVAVETHVWASGTQLPGVQPFPSVPPAQRER